LINEKTHKNLIEYAKKIGCGNYSEDVVQEAYLKCLTKSNDINTGYLYLTVRSIAFDIYRANKKIKKVPIENLVLIHEEDEEKIDILDHTSNLNKMENLLMEIIIEKKISQRKIARESNVSLVTISKTMKKIKTKIYNEWQRKQEVEG